MSISVRNISKHFTPVLPAVDNVSFEVPTGHLVALLGPSGSGKSTILRVIAGLEEPDSGQVFLDRRDVTGSPSHERGIGFVFQHYALFKHATVARNVAFGLEVRRWPKADVKDRVRELLDLVQLQGYEDRYPSQLSGGQRQRVALARALAPRPSVLLLDEPFGALDAKVRRNLAAQLRTLHDEVNTTTVFVTHDQEEAMEIANDIVVLNRGRIEQIGSAEEIYDAPKSRFVASFIGNVNVIEGSVEGDALRIGPGKVPLPGMPPPDRGASVVLLVRPEDIELAVAGDSRALQGIVRDVRYRGDRFEEDIEVAGMVLRRVEMKMRGKHCAHAPGQTLWVRIARHTIFEAEEGHSALRSQLQSLGYIE